MSLKDIIQGTMRIPGRFVRGAYDTTSKVAKGAYEGAKLRKELLAPVAGEFKGIIQDIIKEGNQIKKSQDRTRNQFESYKKRAIEGRGKFEERIQQLQLEGIMPQLDENSRVYNLNGNIVFECPISENGEFLAYVVNPYTNDIKAYLATRGSTTSGGSE